MAANRDAAANPASNRGVSVLIVALGMVFILGMAGLAIDLASLYVARSQAQRAADAAALAGARAFLQDNCTSGGTGTISGTCETLATEQAVAVGNANLVAGVSPGIKSSDVSFPSETTTDPQVQVVAGRGTYNGTNHNNPLSTFFIKIFGVNSASVSATATAEAYNPSGGTAPTGTLCLKPWLLPDCDPDRVSPDPNPACATPAAHLVGPDGAANPAAIGELMSIKPGDPTQAIGPGKFYPVYMPPGEVANACPSCAVGQTSSGSQSGDQYRQNIECCNQTPVVCGTNQILAINGNMVGPTQQGVKCLIHQGNGSSSTQQDTLDTTNMQILSGGYYAPVGTVMGTSDSLATLPIYDGTIICPGGSTSPNGTCTQQASINVIGFMQVFIRDVGSGQGTVYAYILSIVKCPSGSGSTGGGTGGTGGTGGGGGGAIVGTSGTPIPIRLIRQ